MHRAELPRAQGQHVLGHVEAIGLAGGPHAARRKQNIDAATTAQVQYDLAFVQFRERGRIAAAQRCQHRGAREFLGFTADLEVGRDGIDGAIERRATTTGIHGATAAGGRRFAHLEHPAGGFAVLLTQEGGDVGGDVGGGVHGVRHIRSGSGEIQQDFLKDLGQRRAPRGAVPSVTGW